tara:strand:- start:39 stop:839 length:801 start_codon:yes stop_codon:yes gene_type:complete
MYSTAFMCMEDGKLKLDVDATECFEENTPARKLIDKFQSSLKERNVPITRYSEHKNKGRGAVTRVGSTVVQQSDSVGKASPRVSKLGKRLHPDTECTSDKPPKPLTTTDDKAHEPPSRPASPRSNYIKRIDSLRVPRGVCGGDRLAIFDNVKPSNLFIDVPANAYDDMRLEYERPSTPVKLLLVDGNGYKVGGNKINQHATRLDIHRGMCTNLHCPVLGCKGGLAFSLFQNVDNDSVDNYRLHWASACRTAMRSHGLKLQVMASGV